ncbi:hypothetical protein I4U23_009673 [Adineta vaga]|nr:hypothetical protein I4U23_009673 [Adineta vaga]
MYRLLLKSNFIIKIYDHAFDSIADSLIELDLQMNQISNISSKWFNSKFHRLQILNLALNQLETFDDFDHIHLPALRELNLSGNQIEFFPKQIHQWISLTKLDLSFNKLSSIPRFALFGLQNLKWLSLASNRNLTCIVQDSFKHLRLLNYLDLSSTNLFTVDGCIFLQLISLKILKIERVTMNCSSCWLPIARKNSIQSIGQCLDNSTIHNLSSLTDQQLDSSCSKSSIDCSTDSCEPGSFNIDSKSLSSMRQLSTLAKNSNASKNLYRWKQVVRRNRHQHQKQIINNNPTIIESVVTHGANMDVSPSYELSSNNKRKLYNPMFTDTPSNDMNSPQSSTIFLNENRFQKNQLLSENL